MRFDPYGFHIAIFNFRYYGIIIMFGAVAAAFLGMRLLRRMDRDPDIVWDALIWLLIFGIIGARLYHVFTPSQSLLDQGIDTLWYLRHPVAILTTWQGGLGMPGALIGGVLGLYLFARRRNIQLSLLLDIASPGVALAQAIGRWGNFINQELYGPPTDVPWKIFIRPENRIQGFQKYEYFHPLFLYESLWNLANMAVLLLIWNRLGKRLKSGDLFLCYLITYPMGRFLLEFLRLDYVPLWGINFNQMFMLAVALISAGALVWRHRKTGETPQAA